MQVCKAWTLDFIKPVWYMLTPRLLQSLRNKPEVVANTNNVKYIDLKITDGVELGTARVV
ncbi:hypothetical protein BGX23_006318 [Mortierella sp. AD031]|nr:hypothetical protein BGX23_006318 [Mortierella sp. AD031]